VLLATQTTQSLASKLAVPDLKALWRLYIHTEQTRCSGLSPKIHTHFPRPTRIKARWATPRPSLLAPTTSLHPAPQNFFQSITPLWFKHVKTALTNKKLGMCLHSCQHKELKTFHKQTIRKLITNSRNSENYFLLSNRKELH